MIASVIGTFSSLSPSCRRRKPEACAEYAEKHTTFRSSSGKHAPTLLNDSDDIGSISTDVGDHHSDMVTTSGSDTDVRTSVNQRKVSGPPPGLAPPPGLEAPPGLSAPCGHNKLSRITRLNSQAPLFVPHPAVAGGAGQNKTQQLRQSIQHLKTTLADWEGNIATKCPEDHSVTGEDTTLSALQKALSNLTPQDAAKVRTFLDSKDVAERSSGMSQTDSWVPPAAQFHPAANIRQQTNAAGASRFDRPDRSRAFAAQQNRMPETQAKAWSRPHADDSVETLRTNLKDLSEMDSGCVLMVRKINRLGSDSAAAIQEYFAKFGTIDRVMVTHSRSRPTPGGPARLRPATVGFLVMPPEAVQAALDFNGGQHIVHGVSINVTPFKSHAIGVKH